MNKALLNQKLSGLYSRFQRTYRFTDHTKAFSIEPSIQQDLMIDIAQYGEYLKYFNFVSVDEMTGESIIINDQGLVSATADTESGDERPLSFHSNMSSIKYACKKKFFDWAIHDNKLAYWAKYKDFDEKYRMAFFLAFAKERLINGFHGTHYSPKSDKSIFKLLEDNGEGWLKIVELRGTAGSYQKPLLIKIGSGVDDDFVNLDQIVLMMLNTIPVHKRDGLVVVVGAGILSATQSRIVVQNADKPSEKKEVINNKEILTTYGGLPAIPMPFFPQNAVMITKLSGVAGQTESNLSIYTHSGSWVRHFQEIPSKELRVDWNARNETNHVEDADRIRIFAPETVVFTDENLEITSVPIDNFGVN